MHYVLKEMFLSLSPRRKTADNTDAAFGCTTRRSRSQARELLPQPLWRCGGETKIRKILASILNQRPQSVCGSSSRPKGVKATGRSSRRLRLRCLWFFPWVQSLWKTSKFTTKKTTKTMSGNTFIVLQN